MSDADLKSFEAWLEQNNSYTNTTPTNIGAGRGLGGTAQVSCDSYEFSSCHKMTFTLLTLLTRNCVNTCSTYMKTIFFSLHSYIQAGGVLRGEMLLAFPAAMLMDQLAAHRDPAIGTIIQAYGMGLNVEAGAKNKRRKACDDNSQTNAGA